MNARRTVCGAGLLLGLCTSEARAQEYRQVVLQDGRSLLAQVEDTTATGLVLLLPQGRTRVGFDQVASLEEIDAATWEAQGPWKVVVLPPEPAALALSPSLARQLTEALGQIPAVAVSAPELLVRLPASERMALAACGSDAACIQGHLDLSGATAALAVRAEAGAGGGQPELVVTSVWAGAPRARREVALELPEVEDDLTGVLRQAMEAALFLEPQPLTLSRRTPPPPPVTSPPPAAVAAAEDPQEGPRPATLRALAWAPLPGLPSLARRDWAGFGWSWATAVPGTAAMVGVAGRSSFTQEQLLVTGLGSFYVLTVAMNHAFGLRGIDAEVSVLPVPGGGAMLGFTAPLRERASR